MSLLELKPKFLYPHSRQFPFDEVAEKIVRAIEKRNWQVPGITIEFDTYGSGEAKYQMVRSIAGEDFKLYFSRVQGKLNGHWNDPAALHSVCIPKEFIKVFEDESGPCYYLYVGSDWEVDKQWFMNSIKVHAKLHKEPRRYLKYKGNTYKKRPQELVADSDLHREYLPEGDEPFYIDLEQKFNEITTWLEEYVLNYILSFKEADVIQAPTALAELVLYKGPWETIYTLCDYNDAKRIKLGKEYPSELPPEERHAYVGDGRRLVPLDVRCNDSVPKIAHEGFIWCDVNTKKQTSQTAEFVDSIQSAMGSFFGRNHNHIVEIKLKYANEVYVADNSKFDETRQAIFKAIAPRDRLTDEELDDAYASRGATIIPITEYKGDYKEPIVLINRELDFDEISWVVETEK